MGKIEILSMTALALVGSSLAQARDDSLGSGLAERMALRTRVADVAQAEGKQTLSYGSDPMQKLDFYPAKNATGAAPLVLFVHGGGWKRGSKDNADGSWKAPHFTQAGYAYASINYRLVPGAAVEQQGADVAAALRYLLDHSASLNIDRGRVILMGHSAGAHLVALVGTDERYLAGAGLSFRNVVGILPIDGAAYDVTAQMKDGPRLMQQTYVQAFGTDPARQAALSPTMQAGMPNVRSFLIIHVQRNDGVAQSKALQAALVKAGTKAERAGFPGTGLSGHAEINRQLGNPAYPATAVVDEWLSRVFAR